MKIKISILTFLCWAFMIPCFGQNKMSQTERDSLLLDIQYDLQTIGRILNSEQMNENFKLYKTQNMYNFLRLNTSTGQIEQVQWSSDRDKEGSVTINAEDLSFIISEPGIFELYPTENIYTFLLLDKRLGRMWRVQWGFKEESRGIKRIH